MRKRVFIMPIFLLGTIHCFGQGQIDNSIFDSEVEIIISFINFQMSPVTIEIRRDKNGIWEYKGGYRPYREPNIKYQPISKSIDWGHFETQLDPIIIKKLPSQDKVLLKWTIKDRRKWKKHFFGTADGMQYSVVYKYKGRTRRLYYENPSLYLHKLKQLELPTEEHEIFINFTDYIRKYFGVSQLYEKQKAERAEIEMEAFRKAKEEARKAKEADKRTKLKNKETETNNHD